MTQSYKATMIYLLVLAVVVAAAGIVLILNTVEP